MINKQTFLTALGCDTAGWYATNAAPEPVGPGAEWRFWNGAEVGKLARQHLGPGPLLPFGPAEKAVEATTAAMADRAAARIYEATVVHGPFIARADALRRTEGGWELIEVKSALTPRDDKATSDHLDDAAYTTFVARGAGVVIDRCILVYLGRDSRQGAVTFTELDVTDDVVPRAAAFAASAPAIADACAAADRPAPALKFACKDCDFFASQCVGKDIPDPLFLLPRLSEKRFETMKVYQRITAVPGAPDLTAPQHRVYRAVRTGEPVIDREALAKLNELVWPVYYLDFEAVAPALPWFDDRAPYDVMPFQYSIHVCDRPGHEIAHHEYLAPIGGDWRRDITTQMIAALGTVGSITMYTDYEEKRLSAMALEFPDLAPDLHAIIGRLVDLEPIVRNGYCHPGFRGRTSIKNVLPVVAPELSYAAMAVGNGQDAEGLFGLMTLGQRDPVDHHRFREELLAYCKLDTLAMVRLHQALTSL